MRTSRLEGNTVGPLLITTLAAVLSAVSGCGTQAKIVQSRHWDLNETIRDIHDEQLLLNLVRLASSS